MGATLLRTAINRQRENLIDLNIVVDDARSDVNRAVERLQVAVRERDRGAAHLQHLEHLEHEAAGASHDV